MALAFRIRIAGCLFAALIAVFWPAPAIADDWPSPPTAVYFSPDQKVRLTVIPHASVRLGWFAVEEAKRQSPGPDDRPQSENARGLLERMSGTDGWEVVWDRPLLNEVSPVSALVANSGRYVVTFDNWYAQGLGKDAVVIYGPDGGVVRSHRLEDFLPADYVKALPHSFMGAISWQADEHHLSADEATLILKVLVPSRGERGRDHVNVCLDLATGQPLPPGGEAWQQALSEASRVAAARQADKAAAAAAWVAPLVGSGATEPEDWHGYLREVFYRIDPDWKAKYPSVRVLLAPEASECKRSKMRLRSALLGGLYGYADMIASPKSPDNLVKVLAEIGRKAAPGSLNKRRIYVVVEKAYHKRVAAALAPTGATVILLDPADPIPQRRERLAEIDR